MKALVTGSEGFIGKNLVARLKDDGVDVIGFDPKDHGQGMDIIHERHTADVIYHLGCVNQMTATLKPTSNLEVNALLTRDLAVYAKAINARFVYTSTASVYGNQGPLPYQIGDRERPVTEYGIAKLAGEHFVQQIGGDYEIYRLSNVYGPHQTLENPYCGVIGRFIDRAMGGRPLTIIGDGLQTRDYTYVDDVIDRIIYGPFIGSSRLSQLGSGKETSVIELAMTISRLSGDRTTFEWIPERVIDSVKRRVVKSDYPCETSLIDGLTKTIDWFRDSQM